MKIEYPKLGKDFWFKTLNPSMCLCPPSKYLPRTTRPTSPDCPEHGGAYNGKRSERISSNAS